MKRREEKNLTYQIETRVNFRAAHRLMPPYKGKCLNAHGEFYQCIFIFEKEELDECGMVIDFGKVKGDIKKLIDEKYDHGYIHKKGDMFGKILKAYKSKTFEMKTNPTAENIAKLLFDDIIKLYPFIKKVGVIESSQDNIAWYERKGSTEKVCETCGKNLQFSEWCVYHFNKRRDFCSQECYSKFNNEYSARKKAQRDIVIKSTFILKPFIGEGVEELEEL